VIMSFVLVFSATTAAKSTESPNDVLLGAESCDPVSGASTGSEDAYRCIQSNATEWSMDFLETSASDMEKACYCDVVGYSAIFQDANLYNGICHAEVLKMAKKIGITIGATGIVVVINVVSKLLLNVLAETERPWSYSSLNSSKMVKIFALQTLNTAFVVFCVNYAPPDGVPLGSVIFLGDYHDSVRSWYSVVGAAILTNMLANAVTPAATNLSTLIISKVMRCLCARRQQHQALLLKLYTNPEFDMAVRFAQLLTTVFVTLAYSAGMPMLYLFAACYMMFTFWTDKILLLRGSQRPPQYDAMMAKDATQTMLYSIPIHCIFAIWMFGQSCTFPSAPLGGVLADYATRGMDQVNQAAAAGMTDVTATVNGTSYSMNDIGMAAANGVAERVTKEATWMFFLFLVLLVAIWVLWTLMWVLGGTIGEVFVACSALCCPTDLSKVAPTDEDGNASKGPRWVPWEKARVKIEQVSPPASYKMEAHPAFMDVKDYLGETLKVGSLKIEAEDPKSCRDWLCSFTDGMFDSCRHLTRCCRGCCCPWRKPPSRAPSDTE